MAKKNPGKKLVFQEDKRSAALEKSKSDVVPLKRGIYRPVPPTGGTGSSKVTAVPKKKPDKSAKPQKLKNVKFKMNKQLKRNQKMRSKKPKNRC